jgi:hypothetical protein
MDVLRNRVVGDDPYLRLIEADTGKRNDDQVDARELSPRLTSIGFGSRRSTIHWPMAP